jgi:hypothetical protein
MDTKDCDGCAALLNDIDGLGGCYLKDFMEDKHITDIDCPCSICIVKGVCLFDTCSLYGDFDKSISNEALAHWKKK